jgi:hypothetical protein
VLDQRASALPHLRADVEDRSGGVVHDEAALLRAGVDGEDLHRGGSHAPMAIMNQASATQPQASATQPQA